MDEQSRSDPSPGPDSGLSAPAARLRSLDILRGAAILAILLANIEGFSRPLASLHTPLELASCHPVDRWLIVARDCLVTGKARSVLCLLFGAGMWMQRVRRTDWPKSYIRRLAILLAIGLFHSIFIWGGDILVTYALVAMMSSLFVDEDDGIAVVLASSVLAVFLVGSLLFAFRAGVPPGPEGALPFASGLLGAEAEAKVYLFGSWGAQVQHRLAYLAAGMADLAVSAPSFGSLFLCGSVLARRGFFSPEARRKGDLAALLILGLGLGVPLNLLPLAASLLGFGDGLIVVELAGGPILALGIVGLGVLAAPKLPRLVGGLLALIGRTALTSYLSQSILASLIFYSPGLHLYQKLAFGQCLWAVALIWMVNAAFAYAWTRRFQMGPVEWIWRSLEARRALPLRRAPAVT